MIPVTRLNGSQIYLNPDLILSLEATPDVVVTLTSGEKLILRDKASEVVDRFIAYKRAIHTPTVN